MSGSIIIFGGKKQHRTSKLDEKLVELSIGKIENNPDILTIKLIDEKKSISIDQIKEGNKFISKKPLYGKVKVLIIDEAEKINTEGQNALLKTLEEPPSYATIILLAKTQNSVLPTILSRCKRFEVGSKVSTATAGAVFPEFIEKSVGERLTEVAELSKESREECVKQLEDWLETIHDVIQTSQDIDQLKKAANLATITARVKRDIETTNVNLKLALEYLALSIG